MILAILQNLFVRHDWVYDDVTERRSCTRCGRSEELLDAGSGFGGPVWNTLTKGTVDLHFPERMNKVSTKVDICVTAVATPSRVDKQDQADRVGQIRQRRENSTRQ